MSAWGVLLRSKKQGETLLVPPYLLALGLESSFGEIFLEAQIAHGNYFQLHDLREILTQVS